MHEQPTGSDVPVLNANLEVGIETTRSDAATIDGSTAEAPDICDARQESADDLGLFGSHRRLVVEAGGDDGLAEVDR